MTTNPIRVFELIPMTFNELGDRLQRGELRAIRTTEWDEMEFRVWCEVVSELDRDRARS